MGKIVQVSNGYNAVSLPPSGVMFTSGSSQTLTDAEYAGLAAATLRAITVTNPSVADPVRTGSSSPPVSLSDAVSQAVAQSAAATTTAVATETTRAQNAEGLRWTRTVDLRMPPAVLSSGTWTNLNYATSYSTAGAISTPYTQTWITDISPGTWNFTIACLLSPNAAKLNYDYSFDGTTWVNFGTNIDTYAAGATTLGLTSTNGVVVSTASKLYVRITGNGTRNASNTTGYYALCVSFQAQRTA